MSFYKSLLQTLRPTELSLTKKKHSQKSGGYLEVNTSLCSKKEEAQTHELLGQHKRLKNYIVSLSAIGCSSGSCISVKTEYETRKSLLKKEKTNKKRKREKD